MSTNIELVSVLMTVALSSGCPDLSPSPSALSSSEHDHIAGEKRIFTAKGESIVWVMIKVAAAMRQWWR